MQSERRLEDLGPLTEAGFPYVSTTWNGVMTMAAPPKQIVDRLMPEV